MKKLILFYLAMAVLLFTIAGNSFGQSEVLPGQVKENWAVTQQAKKFNEQSVTYLQLSKDLYEILSHFSSRYDLRNPAEYVNMTISKQTAMEIASDLDVSGYNFGAASIFLVLYSFITDPDKRQTAKEFINHRLDLYLNTSEDAIKIINRRLTMEENSVIIAHAIRAKDEIRKGQELLRSAIIK